MKLLKESRFYRFLIPSLIGAFLFVLPVNQNGNLTIPIAVATAPILFTALIIAIKAPIANKILLIEEPNAARRSAIAPKREATLVLFFVSWSTAIKIPATTAIRADNAKTEGHSALESILDTTNSAAAIRPIPIAKFLKDLLISFFAYNFGRKSKKK